MAGNECKDLMVANDLPAGPIIALKQDVLADIQAWTEAAKVATCTNDNEYCEAGEIYSTIDQLIKGINKQRLEITRPIDAVSARILAAVRDALAPLETQKTALSKRILEYKQVLEKRRQAEEKKRRDEERKLEEARKAQESENKTATLEPVLCTMTRSDGGIFIDCGKCGARYFWQTGAVCQQECHQCRTPYIFPKLPEERAPAPAVRHVVTEVRTRVLEIDDLQAAFAAACERGGILKAADGTCFEILKLDQVALLQALNAGCQLPGARVGEKTHARSR